MDRIIRVWSKHHGWLFTLLMAGTLVGSAGCDSLTTCDTDADCKENARCVASYCTTQCVRDSDCRSKTDACEEGHCQPVSDPSCGTDEECVQPGPCQIGTGALCVAGACAYQPRPAGGPCDDGNRCTSADLCNGAGACVGTERLCTKQPASECIGNDDLFVTYSTTGVCDPQSGECTYARTERPCPQCSTDCLVTCLGVSCPDTAGGCQIAGRCIPTWPVARCEYDFAPSGTHCSLPEQPGALLGFCSQGDCVECLADADCKAPPGHAACFTATCVSGACAYTPAPNRVCEVEHCAGGVVYFERRCDAAGQCPAPTPELVSCAGYACNTAGNGCRTTCASTSECVAGLSCRVDNTCEPPRGNGENCTEHGQCASARCQCVDARCEVRKCAPSLCTCRYDVEPDGTCDGFIEDGRDDAGNSCGALSCNGQGGCNLGNGAPCTNAASCESNACADGVCCNEICDGPCVACNLAGRAGTCAGRAAGDGSECSPCQGCSGPAAGCVPQPNEAEGNQCTGPCTACEGGACVLRVTGDATECGTCNECRGGLCSPVTGPSGKNCADADGYCCHGTCVNPPGAGTEYATSCGSGDCTGTWICQDAAARCSSYGAGCDACNGDTVLDGACTGDVFGTSCALLATQTECLACSKCIDNGASASCAGTYASNTEDTVGSLVCTGPAVACDGSGGCKKDFGQTCGSPGECASGFCVDGVCCENACNGAASQVASRTK